MFVNDLRGRETNEFAAASFRSRYHVTEAMVRRLSLERELKGHDGCVNCLQWSRSGDLLLSGSDDQRLNLWSPLSGGGKLKRSIRTLHTGNIFSAKFFPHSNDSLVATGAADGRVQVHDLRHEDSSVRVIRHHAGRVKRLEVSPDSPHLLFSAGEDGLVMQHDLRQDAYNKRPNILVNLNAVLGQHSEAKCLSINPVKPDLLAVGANDEYVRLYDRRCIKIIDVPEDFSAGSDGTVSTRLFDRLPHISRLAPGTPFSVRHYVAGHLSSKYRPHPTQREIRRQITCTYVTFSPDGNELLANMGGEHIYLFSLTEPRASILAAPDEFDKEAEAETFMPVEVAVLKMKANRLFSEKRYSHAIHLYNEALAIRPHPIIYSNRAAAALKRKWNGDIYCALRDSKSAISLDYKFVEAHLRYIQCLLALHHYQRAKDALEVFQINFPDHSNTVYTQTVENEVRENLEADEEALKDITRRLERHVEKKPLDIPVEDMVDFTQTFSGHCNTTTDIKEANFLGEEGRFVAAGSDDGKIFVWDKATSNVVRIFQGDESIVNCLQTHPTACVLASSGIENCVKLWSPRQLGEETESPSDVIEEFEKVSQMNQLRMGADPLEALILDMGFGSSDPVAERDRGRQTYTDGGRENVQCRTS